MDPIVPFPEVENVIVWVPLITSFSSGPFEKLATREEEREGEVKSSNWP